MLKILIILLSLPVINIYGQQLLLNAGAANESLAGVAAVARDEWSLWRNPAGLASIEGARMSFGMRHVSNINVSTKSAIVAVNTRAGTFATGMLAFGDELYNEQAWSLGFAHTIGITNLGIRADALQMRIDGLGVRRTYGATIGASTAIGARLIIGAVARNVNLPKWIDGQPLPVVLNAGLLFIPSDNFLLVAEVEKNTDFDPTLKAAFEYSLQKKFFVRTGFNLFPTVAFGGMGLKVWRLGFDYALRWNYITGYAQQVSVSIRAFKKNQTQ